ncbi:MAG: hypothetical protein ACYDCL_10450 [Myxococcales bacterium]
MTLRTARICTLGSLLAFACSSPGKPAASSSSGGSGGSTGSKGVGGSSASSGTGTASGSGGGSSSGAASSSSGSSGGNAMVDAGPPCGNAGPSLSEGGTNGLASKYPGDVGIEKDPDVLWVENFNEVGGISAAAANWDAVDSQGAITLSTNVPPGSPLAYSSDWNYYDQNGDPTQGYSVDFLKCLAGETKADPGYSCESTAGGSGCCDCGLFCNPLPDTVGSVYFRYYVYVPVGADPVWHFFEMGGGAWCGCAGRQPTGTDYFHSNTDMNLTDWKWDFYTYWVDEHPSGSGADPGPGCSDPSNCYWYGDGLMGGYNGHPDLRPPVAQGRWVSVEIMMKNNTFTGSTANFDGEQAIWIDGQPVVSNSSNGQCAQVVSHQGPGFPLGAWDRSTFCPDNAGAQFGSDGTAGHGYRWRTTPSFNASWIRPEVYEQNAQTAASLDHILIAHIVVAKQYIGPLHP